MNYKLPFQIIDPEICGIISREVQKQEIEVYCASRKHLKEMAAVALQIRTRGLPAYLVRKKLPGPLGDGIFLHPDAQPIAKDKVIAPYAGVVKLEPQSKPDSSAYTFELIGDIHLSKEEHRNLIAGVLFHSRRLYGLSLSAERRGNFTRYINHSEKPNVVAHLVQIPDNPYGMHPAPLQIVYFAKKIILPGEQLLVCYEDGEKSYWNSLQVKPFPMTPRTFMLDESLQLKSPRRLKF